MGFKGKCIKQFSRKKLRQAACGRKRRRHSIPSQLLCERLEGRALRSGLVWDAALIDVTESYDEVITSASDADILISFSDDHYTNNFASVPITSNWAVIGTSNMSPVRSRQPLPLALVSNTTGRACWVPGLPAPVPPRAMTPLSEPS